MEDPGSEFSCGVSQVPVSSKHIFERVWFMLNRVYSFLVCALTVFLRLAQVEKLQQKVMGLEKG